MSGTTLGSSDPTGTWSYQRAFARHDGLLRPEEQEKLRGSHVAIVGMGGVGGVHLVTLGRLGIGKFTIADLDHFETANMNRQYGARLGSLGRAKVEVMAEEIRQINPEVELRLFPRGVDESTIPEFLQDVDLLIDGIDFFEILLRRRLFRQAAENGVYAVTAGPLGFSTAWLTFDPNGMSFDDYFDFRDNQPEMDQVVAFAVGLAPRSLHSSYFDWSRVDPAKKRGPSAGLACQLCAGVAAAEALKILLGRGNVRSAPRYAQFDAYHGQLHTGHLRGGNRHPVQRWKRWMMKRALSAGSGRSAASTPTLRQLRHSEQTVAGAPASR